MILRDDLYFEPRVINEWGEIRWYGERYTSSDMLSHMEETVYIRDNGKELFIYKLNSDHLHETEKIEAVFRLISRIVKRSIGHRYGRSIT